MLADSVCYRRGNGSHPPALAIGRMNVKPKGAMCAALHALRELIARL